MESHRSSLARSELVPLAILTFFLSLTVTVSADGIDIVWLMTRVGGWRVHPVLSVAILLGLMLINYVLNVVVIGIAAARILHIKSRRAPARSRSLHSPRSDR